MRFIFLLLLNISFLQLHAQSKLFTISGSSSKSTYTVLKHQKVEFGLKPDPDILHQIEDYLKTKKGGINPYAEEDITIRCSFLSPSGKVREIDAFYFIPYKRDLNQNKWNKDSTSTPFRIRFAPNETGKWAMAVRIMIKGEVKEILPDFNFQVEASSSRGHLQLPGKKSPNQRQLICSEDQKSFFAIGENITHSNYIQLDPISHERHKKWIRQMADNGGNFLRMEFGAQNFLIDWLDLEDYSGRMNHAMAFDEIVDLCSERDIYFIMFNHHVEYDAAEVDKGWLDRPVQWKKNPYHTQLGIENSEDVFTSEKAWTYLKRRYRYIFSRWGYSPQFSIYEFSEGDNVFGKNAEGKSKYHNDKSIRKSFNEFITRLKTYIQKDLGYSEKIVGVSFASNPDERAMEQHIYSIADMCFVHKYGEQKDENFIQRWGMMDRLFASFSKPCLMEEMGPNDGNLYCCSKIQYHNDMWSTAFMGGIGCGMHWWWDRGIHDNGYYTDLKALSKFWQNEDLSDREYFPRKTSDKMSFTVSARKKRKIETFYLRDKSGDRIYGWTHNATAFWWNESNACMDELKAKKYLSKPCKMEDGAELGCAPPCAAWIDYGSDRFKDDYGKIIPLEKEIIVIPGLKMSPLFGKHHYYQVQWFYTGGSGGLMQEAVIGTDAGGNLSIRVPKMGPDLPYNDYAFKIRYVGLQKGIKAGPSSGPF